MTVSLLLAAQAALHSRIQARAIELGHDLSRPESTVKRGGSGDMWGVPAKPARTVKRGGAVAGIHAWRGRRLLWRRTRRRGFRRASG